jgi:hypothetical protein
MAVIFPLFLVPMMRDLYPHFSHPLITEFIFVSIQDKNFAKNIQALMVMKLRTGLTGKSMLFA